MHRTRFYRFGITGMILLGILSAGSITAARAEAPDNAQINSSNTARTAREAGSVLLLPVFANLHLAASSEDESEEDSEESASTRIDALFLPATDTALYREIFAAQEHADWKTADELIAKLQDTRLLGHVLYQRYMHPTGYKTSYEELSAWLAQYSDLPGSKRIFRLAQRRQPAKSTTPVKPLEPVTYIRGGLPSAATMASTEIPAWDTALAAWETKDYTTALSRFQQVARSPQATPWEQAAGAYWTARCLTRLHRPAEVSTWLRRAAQHKRTFYGLIALHQLGLDTEFNWNIPTLTIDHMETIAQYPGGQRALALLQLGYRNMAEQELRRLDMEEGSRLEEALLALSSATGLSNLALRIGTAVTMTDGSLYDAALYPLPQWQPDDGFRVNKALIFALMRQESHFVPTAKSQAGAIGLMQLMPTTASFIAGRRFTEETIDELKDPHTNITLGQKYLEHLLNRRDVNGNLFYALAAYNSGPTQLNRWKHKMGIMTDPLLFLENLPATETRDFTERVLANYWIYQMRIGEDAGSLEQIVAGDWPMYDHDDDNTIIRVAESTSRLSTQ